MGLDDESDGSGVSGRASSSKRTDDHEPIMPEDAEHSRTPKHLPSVTDLFGPEVASPRSSGRSVHQPLSPTPHEQKS